MSRNPEFFYHRKNGSDKSFSKDMDLSDLAVEPAYIARRIYQAIMKQDPAIAEAFKSMVIDAVTCPVTWDLTDAKEPTISAVILGSDKTELPN